MDSLEADTKAGDMDQAYDFLTKQRVMRANTEEAAPLVDVDLRRLRRKIDLHIVPIMFLCYTMQFLDKVLLNYGAVMGLTKDLQLKGNEFANASTFFNVAYLITEIANGFILNKVPAGKWLGINVTLWGIATACTAAARGYSSLLAARIFLGIFEAAIAPCLALLTSQWYTKSEQAPRFTFWYMGLGAGQIIGGLVSFGFQHASHTGFSGWRIMFVTLGCVTVVIGIVTAVFLPDSPLSVRWLNDAERAALLLHISENRTGVVNRHFSARQVLEVVTDVQLWLIAIMTCASTVPSGVISTFSATLLKNMGFSTKLSALLNTPSGVVSIIAAAVGGLGVRHTSNRWAWIVALATPGIIGGALMSFTHSKGGVLAGIYLVNTVTAILPIIYQWVASNVAGHTKRSLSFAIVAGSFGVGNIIGPQTFQAKDAPQYTPAKAAVLGTQAGAAVISIVLAGYYVSSNRSRDRRTGPPKEPTMEEKWANLTDKENTSFRYVL